MSNLDNFIIDQLKDEKFQKEYINETLSEYLEDGDFNAFFRSLEYVIKARDNISAFCEKAGIDRSLLYDIFSGKRVPKFDTMAKILKQLGCTIQVA